MTRSSVSDCKVIALNKIHNRAGNITTIEGQSDVPFNVRRIYYLYDVPGGADRGGHSHVELYQLIVAASGSFKVILDDGTKRKTVTLNRPDSGLLVVPGIWRELIEFSSGGICLVLASTLYNERDYIRDYAVFLNRKTNEIQ